MCPPRPSPPPLHSPRHILAYMPTGTISISREREREHERERTRDRRSEKQAGEDSKKKLWQAAHSVTQRRSCDRQPTVCSLFWLQNVKKKKRNAGFN